MILLSKREWGIVQYLLDQEDVVSIEDLSAKFGASERTIRYDLEGIEYFLNDYDITLCRKSGVGVWIEDRALASKKLRDKIQYLDGIKGRALSQDERVLIIIGLLFYEPDFLTFNDIADSLLISRSTVVKDLVEAEDWLKRHNIQLIKKPRLGVKAFAEEVVFRNTWMEFISENLSNDAFRNFLYSIRPSNESDLQYQYVQRLARGINIQSVKYFLFQVSDELGVVYTDETIYELTAYFCIAIKRMRHEHLVSSKNSMSTKITDSEEYRAVSKNISKLEKENGIEFTEGELYQVTVRFISAKAIDINPNTKVSESETGFIYAFISEIGTSLGIDLTGDSVLAKNLLVHIKPTLNRLRYDIMIVNPLREQIKRTYNSTFNAVKAFTKSIEGKTGFTINDDEIGYLTTHIVCAIERVGNSEKHKKIRVVVACASSIGTSKLLSSRLVTEFDNIEIVNEVSISQIGQYLEYADLIISTAPINGIVLKPVITVSPLLDLADIEKINKTIQRILGKDAVPVASQVDKIVKTVNQFCKIPDVDELKTALETTLYDRKNTIKLEDQKLLLEMVDINRIKTNLTVRDKNDAIRKAGALLFKDGYISDNYVDAMIRLTEELNAYMVIAPGLAMPHARPEDGAIKTGFSIITLKEPIIFGHEKNDPVKLVIALSAVDNVGHLKAMRELSMLIADDAAFEKFKNCNTGAEMLEIISQVEQRFLEKQKERRR